MRRVILFIFSERAVWGGGGGGVCYQTFSVVLFSLLSRPRAGLATVQSSFFGLATNTLNVKNNVYFQVNNGVLYFMDYEDNLHYGPLCSRFNVVVVLLLLLLSSH